MKSHNNVRHYVEGRIKSALEAGSQEDFISWLAVAQGGVFNPDDLNYEFLDGKFLFDYAIERSKELQEEHRKIKMQQQSAQTNQPHSKKEKRDSYFQLKRAVNNTKKYLLPSQSLIRNIMQASTSPKEVKLSSWQKFLKNKIQKKASTAEKTTAEKSESKASFEQFIEKLRTSIEINPAGLKAKKAPNLPTSELNPETPKKKNQNPSLPEEYTPLELLQNPKLLKKRMTKTGADLPSQYNIPDEKKTTPQQSLPDHLRQWASPLQLSQRVNIEEKQAQQQVQDEKRQVQEIVDVDAAQDLQADKGLSSQESEYSDLSERKAIIAYDPGLGVKSSESGLKSILERELKMDPSKNKKHVILISANAKEVLEKHDKKPGTIALSQYSYADRISADESMNLDTLPYGFHISDVTTHEGIRIVNLFFSDKLRKDLLEKGVQRIDLGGLEAAETKQADKSVDRDKDAKHEEISLPKIAAMISTDLSPTSLPDFFTETKKMGFGSSGSNRDILLSFLDHYFITVGQFGPMTEFKHALLTKLFRCSEAELALFIKLSLVNAEKAGAKSFEDICAAVFNFSDFLKASGHTITNETVTCIWPWGEPSSGENTGTYNLPNSTESWLRLRLLQDCLSLSSSFDLQMALIHCMPKKLNSAQSFMRRGYAFVHRNMFLDYWNCPEDPAVLINQDYNSLLTLRPCATDNRASPPFGETAPWEGIHNLQAVYLRYLASSVQPDYINEALDEWKKITGQSFFDDELASYDPAANAGNTYDILNPKMTALAQILEHKWPQIQAYLQRLPKRLDTVKEYRSTALVLDDEKEAKEKKLLAMHYDVGDMENLFSTLKLDTSLAATLRQQIKSINGRTREFVTMSGEALQSYIDKIKTTASAKDKEKTPLDLVELTCVLREIHYRETLYRSKANPKTGEWLRLEQLITILAGADRSGLFQNETSEGKTLIIAFIAMLDALQGNKVNLITHTELMAERAFDELKPLADRFKLEITNKEYGAKQINESAIYCVDISTAVIDDALAQFSPAEEKHVKRNTAVCLIDEADNIAIDVHANTTMQISVAAKNEPDPQIEAFVSALNHIIRTDLNNIAERPHLTQPAAQRSYIEGILREKNISIPASQNLDYWIKAAVSAMNLKLNQDYIIQADRVRIVHKKTTGSVDQRSEWGNGVHYCVSAWEKSQNHPSVKLPGFSEILAEGDVASYIQKHPKRCAFTGTFGSNEVLSKMREVIGTPPSAEKFAVLVMPRAKRPAPPEASWPRKRKPNVEFSEDKTLYKPKQGEPRGYDPRKLKSSDTAEVFNRSYSQPVQCLDTRKEHLTKLLEFLSAAKEKKLSSIVQFTTIEECDQFAELLKLNGLGPMQVFDNKPATGNEAKLRPGEDTVKKQASWEGMITLTTAAGGRGIDYKGIDLCVLTNPSLGRVSEQQKSRIGRNGQLGLIHEIYCKEDFDSLAQQAWKDQTNDAIPNADKKSDSVILEEMQKRMQTADLELITQRQPARTLKKAIQNEIAPIIREKPDLRPHWTSFFSSINQEQDTKQIESKWAAFKQQHDMKPK